MSKLYLLLFLSIILNIKAIEEENIVTNSSNSSNTKKNLLIIAITNYDWEKIAVFFNSYVKAKFENTDFVAFVNNINKATIDRLKSYGAIIIPFPEELKNVHIFTSRWAAISYFLTQNLDKYHLVFTSDTRDAFFQKDVFKYYEKIDKPFLGLAYENGFLTQEPSNRNWIIRAFGQDYFKTLKNERIICIGTLWGTADKVLQFSNKIFEILNNTPKSVDQPVANYMIYHLKLFQDCSIISKNDDGPIMTIGITNRAFINLDSDQNFINYKGDVVAYVHQYDRHKDLTKIVNDKYYTKVNEFIDPKPIQFEPSESDIEKSDINKPELIQSEPNESDIKKSDINKPEPIKSEPSESDIKKSDANKPEPIKSDIKKFETKETDIKKSNDDNNKQENKKDDNNKKDNKKNDNGINSNFILAFFVIFILVSFIIGLYYFYQNKQQLNGKNNEEKYKYNLLII